MRAWCAPLLAILLLPGCAGPIEVRREVPDGPEQVTDRIAARLTELGLTVSDRSAAGLTARSSPGFTLREQGPYEGTREERESRGESWR